MSLNDTPTAERTQIGIFGKVNAGKSSVLNALTGQETAVVSAQEGTTTDPVKKAMELLPIGPVMLYDTPGLADESALGTKREEKTEEILRRIDTGLVVVDAALAVRDGVEDGERLKQDTACKSLQKPEFDKEIRDRFSLERELIKKFRQRKLPYLVIANKIDCVVNSKCVSRTESVSAENEADDNNTDASGDAYLYENLKKQLSELLDVESDSIFPFSCNKDWLKAHSEGMSGYSDLPTHKVGRRANKKSAVARLRERIAQVGRKSVETAERHLVSDLIQAGDVVMLVVPIDESAPKGRLILPQQQVIRDILDAGAVAMAVQPSELPQALERLKEPPRLVITDSQAFGQVSEMLPREIPLTSFSILMARYKGDLAWQAAGAKTIDRLDAGARILISEGCTHHRQCGDIGTVKLPNWIEKHTGKRFDYHFTSGGEFPGYTEADERQPDEGAKSAMGERESEIKLSDYDLVIHCGGCTLPPQEMAWRLSQAKAAGVPMTNYGTMIAYLHGILERAMELLAGSNYI